MESSLTLYLQSISQYPLLTADQEKELGRKYKDEGDMVAREQLINSNLRLVVSVAKNFRNGNHNISLEDLIQEGNSGLLTAVEKFDYTRGFRFSTCAVPWIKQAITKSIIDSSRAVRIPAHIVQKFNVYRNACEKLYAEGNDKPSLEEIAKEMKTTVEDLRQLLTWKKNASSLDTPIGDEEDTTLGDLVTDTYTETPEDYAERMIQYDLIDKMINELDPRTQTIFKLRFGLGKDGDPEEYQNEHTLEEIGTMLKPSITRERVRQIINNQISKWKIIYGDKFSM